MRSVGGLIPTSPCTHVELSSKTLVPKLLVVVGPTGGVVSFCHQCKCLRAWVARGKLQNPLDKGPT